jgi:hypothetical protein
VTNVAGDLAGYNYYRKAEACASSSLTMDLIVSLGNVLTYEDTDISSAATAICVKVASRDATGNVSALSTGTDETLTPPVAPLPFRITLATDLFDRENSADLSSAWDAGYTSAGPFSIVSEEATPTTGNTNTFETYNAVTMPNNQWACAPITKFTTNGNGGVILRFANAPTLSGYIFKANLTNPSATILKATAGAFAVLKSNNTYTFAIGDDVCGESDGTTHRIFKRTGEVQTLIDSVEDATFPSGKAGIFAYAVTQPAFSLGSISLGSLTPADLSPASVSSVVGDTTGADLTFTGLAYKVRYWNVSVASKTEVTGLAGVANYRLNVAWASDVTFGCFEAQGSDGVWESDVDPNSYRCINIIPGTPADTTAPDIPTELEIH